MDRFTKALLSVIAASFAILAYQSISPPRLQVWLCGPPERFATCGDLRIQVDGAVALDNTNDSFRTGGPYSADSASGTIPLTIHGAYQGGEIRIQNQ